jgi:hypothetical protein
MAKLEHTRFTLHSSPSFRALCERSIPLVTLYYCGRLSILLTLYLCEFLYKASQSIERYMTQNKVLEQPGQYSECGGVADLATAAVPNCPQSQPVELFLPKVQLLRATPLRPGY